MSSPYDYYPAVLYAIQKISEGCTKTAACGKANISVSCLNAYINNNDEIQILYEEADALGSDAMADALVTIDNHELYGHTDPKMASVVSKNIQWLLARRYRKQYGDKVEVELSVTADKAIVDALNRGKERAEGIEHTPMLDITPVVVNEDDALMSELLSFD